MIETLYGRIFETNAERGSLILECGGVGYAVTVSQSTVSRLPSPVFAPDGTMLEGAPVRIFTHLSVREDGVELFGFLTREELEMFRLLIGVSGIGPKAGMSILAMFSPRTLAKAIEAGDTKAISGAPGIGPKTAARITLELKDKIKKVFPLLGLVEVETVSPTAAPRDNSKLTDTRDALLALGYSRSEIAAAMKDIDFSLDLEEIIKTALTALMKN